VQKETWSLKSPEKPGCRALLQSALLKGSLHQKGYLIKLGNVGKERFCKKGQNHVFEWSLRTDVTTIGTSDQAKNGLVEGGSTSEKVSKKNMFSGTDRRRWAPCFCGSVVEQKRNGAVLKKRWIVRRSALTMKANQHCGRPISGKEKIRSATT